MRKRVEFPKQFSTKGDTLTHKGLFERLN